LKFGLQIRQMVLFLILLPLLTAVSASASRLSDTGASFPGHSAAVEIGGDFPLSHAVLVEKQSQTLFLLTLENGVFQEAFRAPCSTGEVFGAKSRSGDKKTPEGVYFFIKEHPKRDLSPIYGSRAFPIDYPNLMDRLAGRNGNAIWLHGTNKRLEPRDSNGCIVVENETIDRLANYITLHRTPIIIADRFTEARTFVKTPLQKGVQELVDRWAAALYGGTYHDYLSVYDPGYLPDLSWWRDWDRLRRSFHVDGQAFTVLPAKLAVFQYRGLYTVLFDQMVRTPFQEAFVGTRKLFMARGPEGLRIVGDEDQVLAENLKDRVQGHALVAAFRKLKKTDHEQEIVAMVDSWLEAWSSMDIERYAAYYSQDFRSQDGADLDEWLEHKKRLNRKYRFIRVTRKNKLTIEPGERQSTVSFVQNYASNAFQTTGVKKLILKREGNQWKILREMFDQS